jgi:hypothetical protein
MAKGRTPGKKAARTIGVESGLVSVVPDSAARSYVRSEIEREGFHRSGCTPIVLFPRSEAGEATREWVERMFAAMDEVRRTHPREALETAGLSPDGAGVDVGIIDIPVTFRGPLGLVASNLEHRSAEFLGENLRHVDGLFSGTFHDQMTLATVLHAVRPDGTPEIHYHNLIFGVRREFREGRTLTGPLDLKPVLAALTRRLRLGIVA